MIEYPDHPSVFRNQAGPFVLFFRNSEAVRLTKNNFAARYYERLFFQDEGITPQDGHIRLGGPMQNGSCAYMNYAFTSTRLL